MDKVSRALIADLKEGVSFPGYGKETVEEEVELKGEEGRESPIEDEEAEEERQQKGEEGEEERSSKEEEEEVMQKFFFELRGFLEMI